jgi:D-glycero-D-manno-heptose 1,7-bisphosphate phosphatase
MNQPRRAVFLDRDGVLNRAVVREGRPYPPARLAELELMPDAEPACTLLRAGGFLLILVTNQPDIARGAQTLQHVDEINRYLQRELQLDDLRVCPHDDSNHCACRKPSPGLLIQAASCWHIDLAESFMVGDRWRDVEAGRRAGCRSVFIDYDYREKRPAGADYEAHDLFEAAAWIVTAARKRELTDAYAIPA